MGGVFGLAGREGLVRERPTDFAALGPAAGTARMWRFRSESEGLAWPELSGPVPSGCRGPAARPGQPQALATHGVRAGGRRCRHP